MSTRLNLSDIPSRLDPALHNAVDGLFETALKERLFSGASLLVAAPGAVLLHKTWGRTRSGGSPVDRHTRFDLASLTKPLVTATLFMRAVSENRFGLDDPLSRFFPPAFLPVPKRNITLRHLLNHCSGLAAHEPFYVDLIKIPKSERRSALLSAILQSPLQPPPGTVSRYSDLGFILLGMILEETYGEPLDRLASRLIFEPLHAAELGFIRLDTPCDPTFPPAKDIPPVPFVATEECSWRKRLLEAEVHDDNCYALGGVAGHAGLFGTACGMLLPIEFLWSIYRGERRDEGWSTSVVREFWRRQDIVPGSTWALGFDTPSPEGSSAGTRFSRNSVGHLGFTGTSLWLDLDNQVLVVLLTNRVHPSRRDERIKGFRPLLHNTVMEALYDYSK
ncbi:MAG: serine hydrolase domain-containing protein [Acidobacteriota bacterium]